MKKLKNTPTPSYRALTAIASITLTLAIGALFTLKPQTVQATDAIHLNTARVICRQGLPTSQLYSNCDEMVLRLALRNQIRNLVLSPAYKSFANCAEAVDYIFDGRWDQSRAKQVVFRESTNNPLARRAGSQYVGCAQISATIQRLFLQGPWEDPYFNVLALRDAVDNPHWGWCHWDLVNYCRYGGEF